MPSKTPEAVSIRRSTPEEIKNFSLTGGTSARWWELTEEKQQQLMFGMGLPQGFDYENIPGKWPFEWYFTMPDGVVCLVRKRGREWSLWTQGEGYGEFDTLFNFLMDKGVADKGYASRPIDGRLLYG